MELVSILVYAGECHQNLCPSADQYRILNILTSARTYEVPLHLLFYEGISIHFQ